MKLHELQKMHIKSRVIVNANNCWIWQGFKRLGYGIKVINHKHMGVHRLVAYLWWRTDIKNPKIWVLHKCDTPACCNPRHLYIGTPKDNSRDRDKRKRLKWLYGEKNPQTRLSSAEVSEIIELVEFGITRKDIAEAYGVCCDYPTLLQKRKVRKNG